MATNVAVLESEAIAIMRKAAVDRLPVDAGFCGQLAEVVRDAYRAGEVDTGDVLRSAVEEYLNDQKDFLGDADLELLREAFAEITEAIK